MSNEVVVTTPVVLNQEAPVAPVKEVAPTVHVPTRNERISALITDHVEAPEIVEKPAAEDKRIAALTRKQKEFRDEEAKIKTARASFDAHSAKIQPILDAVENMSDDPTSVLALLDVLGGLRGKAASEFMDEIADTLLAKPKPVLSVEEVVDAKLKAKADKDEAVRIEAEKKYSEEQFNKQKDYIKDIVVANSDKYELIQDEPNYEEQVFQAQFELFQSTGKLYKAEDLLDTLEAQLEQKILSYKKVAAKTSSKEAQVVSRGKRDTVTLTHQSTSSGTSNTSAQPLSRAEKLKRAIAKANSI